MNLGRAEAAVQTSLALLRQLLTSSAEVRTAVLTGNSSGSVEPVSSDDDLSMMEIDPSAPLIDVSNFQTLYNKKSLGFL